MEKFDLPDFEKTRVAYFAKGLNENLGICEQSNLTAAKCKPLPKWREGDFRQFIGWNGNVRTLFRIERFINGTWETISNWKSDPVKVEIRKEDLEEGGVKIYETRSDEKELEILTDLNGYYHSISGPALDLKGRSKVYALNGWILRQENWEFWRENSDWARILEGYLKISKRDGVQFIPDEEELYLTGRLVEMADGKEVAGRHIKYGWFLNSCLSSMVDLGLKIDREGNGEFHGLQLDRAGLEKINEVNSFDNLSEGDLGWLGGQLYRKIGGKIEKWVGKWLEMDRAPWKPESYVKRLRNLKKLAGTGELSYKDGMICWNGDYVFAWHEIIQEEKEFHEMLKSLKGPNKIGKITLTPEQKKLWTEDCDFSKEKSYYGTENLCESWHKNKLLHREDGPAFTNLETGAEVYYLNGFKLTPEQFGKINKIGVWFSGKQRYLDQDKTAEVPDKIINYMDDNLVISPGRKGFRHSLEEPRMFIWENGKVEYSYFIWGQEYSYDAWRTMAKKVRLLESWPGFSYEFLKKGEAPRMAVPGHQLSLEDLEQLSLEELKEKISRVGEVLLTPEIKENYISEGGTAVDLEVERPFDLNNSMDRAQLLDNLKDYLEPNESAQKMLMAGVAELNSTLSTWHQVGYRMAAHQMGDRLCDLLALKWPKLKNLFLKGAGRALVYQAVGWFLLIHPDWRGNPKVFKLAAELRTEGLALIGCDLMEIIFGAVSDTFLDHIGSLELPEKINLTVPEKFFLEEKISLNVGKQILSS